jgi:large subunit ribosomal protein L24
MKQSAPAIKKNDNVVVISGKYRNRRGRVLSVLPDKGRIVVEGVHMIKRHTRPNPQKNVKGGIIEREAAFHASNVQLVCPECGATTRIGRRLLDDGRRVRYCVKCKGVVDR